MTNAQDARLVRITTRALGGSVSNQIPLTAGKDNRFEVVVEGIAGILLSTSDQPYSLDIAAFDISAGTNPHSENNNFTQRRSEAFTAVNGWPEQGRDLYRYAQRHRRCARPPSPVLCYLDERQSDRLLRREPAVPIVPARSKGRRRPADRSAISCSQQFAGTAERK